MNGKKNREPLLALAMTILGLFATTAEATGAHDREVIIEWNQALQANIPASAALSSFRYYAMMHIAMFDSINSIQKQYSPYHVRVAASDAASAEAAGAQAAHDVLVNLVPAAQPTFDALLRARLARINPRRAALGVSVGKRVASEILDWRTGDGFEQPNLAYLPPALPGLWQAAAPGQVAAFVQFANAEPFGLLTATQYLPAPPPLLNSPEYSAALAQVKEVGSVGSTTRTADQTLVANLFAGLGYGPGPFALWSQVAREVTRSRNLTLIQTARVFALVNAAMNDGLQTAHTSKYIYSLWRPVTAIRRADEDMNDQTAADAAWTPLLATPPYPSHSSNLTCVGRSAARSLQRLLSTDAIPFTVTWTGTGGNPNVTRSYSGFEQLAEEAGLSRVYGGIHFIFEIDASHEACTKVADYLADHYMRRRGH